MYVYFQAGRRSISTIWEAVSDRRIASNKRILLNMKYIIYTIRTAFLSICKGAGDSRHCRWKGLRHRRRGRKAEGRRGRRASLVISRSRHCRRGMPRFAFELIASGILEHVISSSDGDFLSEPIPSDVSGYLGFSWPPDVKQDQFRMVTLAVLVALVVFVVLVLVVLSILTFLGF